MRTAAEYIHARHGHFVAMTMLFLVSINLYAQQSMTVSLKGSAEAPPVVTSAAGSGSITVLLDHSVSGTIKTTGMTAMAAHIHEGATGQSGPVVITLIKTANADFVVPANSRLTDAQFARYMAGQLYINVHSAKNPDGEIRGQLSGPEIMAAPIPSGK